MIWLLGRVAWGSELALPAVFNNMFQNSDPIHSEILEYPNNNLLAQPFQLAPHDWIDGNGQFSDFDFMDPLLQAPKQAQHGQSLHKGGKPFLSKPAKARIIGSQSPEVPNRSGGVIKPPFPSLSKTVELIDQKPIVQPAKLPINTTSPNTSRLSVYFWFFARSGSSPDNSNRFNSALQPGSAQYGGSQAGAIFSYRLTGDQDRNLAAYSRVSSPLAVGNAGEIAVGTRIKPLKGLPVSVYAEKRFRESALDSSATALFVAGGSGPAEIATDTYLESYGQAGYVFQDNGSYFFDGSVSIQRRVFSKTSKQLSLGGAIWAGGQEGARRLDIGPRVNIDLPIGDIPARISVDWRQRVAGRAEPDSGIAISLSTGF